ncbi:hypothetical protein ABT354_20145 [Streptomyces sp. NPDC000594]|uniref:hypothetical protein n=1 Tax=Streptomyces sp. NPDC000594 TaxID=3154261 RepID=UPI003323DBBE
MNSPMRERCGTGTPCQRRALRKVAHRGPDAPGLALLEAVRAGDDGTVRDAATGALRQLTTEVK